MIKYIQYSANSREPFANIQKFSTQTRIYQQKIAVRQERHAKKDLTEATKIFLQSKKNYMFFRTTCF